MVLKVLKLLVLPMDLFLLEIPMVLDIHLGLFHLHDLVVPLVQLVPLTLLVHNLPRVLEVLLVPWAQLVLDDLQVLEVLWDLDDPNFLYLLLVLEGQLFQQLLVLQHT